jgi:hypothetical protein
MKYVSFQDLNAYAERKLSYSSVYFSPRYSFLKIFQHALSYAQTESTHKKIGHHFHKPLWLVKVIYLLKALKLGNWPSVKILQPIVIIDKGRLFEEDGQQKSYYFDRIQKAIGAGRVALITQKKEAGLPASTSISELGPARGRMSVPVEKMWKEIRTIIRSVSKSTEFSNDEKEYIASCFHIFFEDFFRYHALFSQQKKVTRCYFCVHYHQEGLIAALRECGIESFEIQHGLISANDYYYVYSNALKEGVKNALFPDYIGLYGNYWRGILLRGCEWRPEQLVVLGDYLPRKKELPLPPFPKKNQLFIGAQKNMCDEYVAYVHHLSKNVLPHYPDWQVVVKVHPLEKRIADYKKLENPQVKVVGNESSLDDLLMESRIQVSIYSTTFYDALGFDVLNLSIRNYSPSASYAEETIREGVAEGIDFDADPIGYYLSHPTGQAQSLERNDVYGPFNSLYFQD